MGRRSPLGILMFLLVLALVSGESLADTYTHCPDHAHKCVYSATPLQPYLCSNVTSAMCEEEEVEIRYINTLISVWNDSVPFFSTLIVADAKAVINSAQVAITLESNNNNCEVFALSRNCSSGEFITHSFFAGKDTVTRTIDVTGELSGCSDVYDIRFFPSIYRIDVESVNIDVDYDIIVIPGELTTSISTEPLPENTVGMYEDFETYSSAYCSGGDCGNVELNLQYSSAVSGVFHDIPDTVIPGIPFFAIPSPFECGELDTGNPSCSIKWDVRATEPGTYEIRALAESDKPEVEEAVSASHEVKVVAGSLLLDNVRFDQNPIEPGGFTTFMANLSCLDHYCGDVAVLAKNGLDTITNQTPFTIYDENPQFIDNMYPGTEQLTWVIRVDTPGQYDIYAAADNDIVPYAEGYAYPPLTVAEPAVGILSLSNAGLSPQSIKEGESTVLQGVIECSNGPCGQVLARAQQEGVDIPDGGTLSTTGNPWDCDNMEDGDSCPASWDITANNEGEYSGISILAESQDIPDAESPLFTLTVGKNLGDIIVSADINPAQINISESSVVSGTIGCSGDYCGELAAYLRYSDGTLVGASGNLSTSDPNPIHCQNPPCGLHWDVAGNINNIYMIMVDVHSNESISNHTDNIALYVNDPDIPDTPSLHIDTVQDTSELVGTMFDISAKVFCFSADCGETMVYIQFSEGGQWINLTQWTELNTQNNMKTELLGSGESKDFTWSVNSSQSGEFEMRVIAESTLAGNVHMPFTADIYPPGVPDVIGINIRSPGRHQTFLRGEELSLEIFVTENYQPKEGLSPSASFSGSLYATIQLDDMGEGIYRSSIPMPTWADGEYNITFQSGDVQESVGIDIDPSLDVWVSTDKTGYAINEIVSISGGVNKRGILMSASLNIILECQDGWKHSEPYFIVTNSTGVFQHDLVLPEHMPSGECMVNVFAEDESGNSGLANSIIYVVNEKDVYDVVFAEPSTGNVFTVGEDIGVRLNVLMNGIPVDDADVRCTDSYGIFNRLLTISGPGEYSGTFSAERVVDGGDSWSIQCKAKTADGSLGSGSVEVGIIPLLEIALISPNLTLTEVEKGDTVHFMVVVSYSDGGYMDKGNVTLIIENNTILLGHTSYGTYEGRYTIGTEGELNVAFLARDADGNTKYYEMMFESLVIPYVNWLGVISTISGIIILWLLWFLNKTRHGKTIIRTVTKTIVRSPDRRSKLKDRIKDLEKEKSAIEKAKEGAEMEYYHRKLNESEFRKMMEGYEQESLKKDAEIQEFRKELESLVNTNK